ncbi:MAG: glycoside hydrolase family 97 protein [Ignavibacteriae bacterium]|nr:glycoside hydrolase family 97 protein [Ignavibacteriota bacterium]
MKKKFQLFLLIFLLSIRLCYSQNYILKSPNEKLIANIVNNQGLKYTITYNNINLVKDAEISINIDEKEYPLLNSNVVNFKNSYINENINSVIPTKSIQIKNNCNELILIFRENIWVVFRAFNNGFAYRIITDLSNPVKVFDEKVNIKFAENFKIYFPEEESFISHYERNYKYLQLNEISEKQFCSLPALIDCNNGIKIGITESGLSKYPNLFLNGSSSNNLIGIFPKFVIQTEQDNNSDRNEKITKEANYIAEIEGSKDLPWRIFMISENDKDLLENQLVYILSDESAIKETSWIKPGKVAWDWWNANNIYGVDFKSGINTETYKYYIDFANKFSLDYIILDEGWSKTTTNILESNDELNIEELINYGKQKNVGIILWVLWKPLNENLAEVLDKYKEWGAKGIKVDFMQRADQWMVNYYEKVLIEASKRQLLVDFHGAFKPAGLVRKYPNYISNEGVKGLENCKWSEEITPDFNCTLPFTRMLAGPIDYTPGAMINSEEKNFRIIFEKPMSQGTRAHQIALYVILESPLQMLADNPSNYYANETSTKYISKIPTIWDVTISLEGKVGDYVLVARKKDNIWYIGGITDWTERDFEIKFDFLENKNYNIEIAKDGINANRYASDIKFVNAKIKFGDTIKIHLAKGGGFTAILTPVE